MCLFLFCMNKLLLRDNIFHVWWDYVTDISPPLSLLTFPHHGGILSWWECAGYKPLSSSSIYLEEHRHHHKHAIQNLTVAQEVERRKQTESIFASTTLHQSRTLVQLYNVTLA